MQSGWSVSRSRERRLARRRPLSLSLSSTSPPELRHGCVEQPHARLRADELRYWQSAAAGDVGSFSDRNRALHDFVVELAGNVHMPRMLDQTLLVLFASQFRAWLPPGSTLRAAEQHVEILEAIARVDARGAEAAMKRHIRDARRAMARLPDDAFGAA
jgi:DNA-binding GntR family transcriptional regulator